MILQVLANEKFNFGTWKHQGFWAWRQELSDKKHSLAVGFSASFGEPSGFVVFVEFSRFAGSGCRIDLVFWASHSGG